MSNEYKRERYTNIDLLRVVMTIGVIVLHWNNPGGAPEPCWLQN